ncbi:MAG: DUF763 domain-containing protein [Thermoplasmatales archaeon]|nr:DUF763 domain-containing protein [Thermoplasmatales archaeon]MCK4996498.1 DUF763 domain-containing protein [Thermoplasmatales archaeon]
MAKTGVANLPLHPGKAPRWLFKRMVALSKGITEVISYEYGKDEFLRRLSDPFWFQAFSCVLGFDYHSSGTTTVTCGALKEAINSEEFGLTLAGGKGKASRKTPQEIEKTGELYNFSTVKIEELQYSSRMVAKIDNTAIQDGHDLYHHVFLFSENGLWTIIQQGMNNQTNYARRYHWFSENVDNFVCEPHNAILGEKRQEKVLDMTAKQSGSTQKISVDLVNDNPRHLKRDWAELTRPQIQRTLDNWMLSRPDNKPIENLTMPRSINWNKMKEIYDFQPKNYEELLSMHGVGPNTVRALALISDLIYGEKPSWDDPIKFSFAHGGKDGVPFPVDRKAMDESTEIIRSGVQEAKIGEKDKLHAIERLHNFISIWE